MLHIDITERMLSVNTDIRKMPERSPNKRSNTGEGFRNNRKASKLLKTMVENGETEGLKSEKVRQSRDIFHIIASKNFRDALYRLRKINEQFDSKPNLRESIRRRINGTLDDEDMNASAGGGMDALGENGHISLDTAKLEQECDNENTLDLHTFIAEWKEKSTKRKCVSIAILLPSGATQIKGNMTTFVDDLGLHLIVEFRWPKAFAKADKLHVQWIQGANGITKIENYHPRIAPFQDSTDKLRTKNGKDTISTVRVGLPFPARPRLTEKYFLGWEQSDEVALYCTLEALEEPDPDSDSDDEITIVRVSNNAVSELSVRSEQTSNMITK